MMLDTNGELFPKGRYIFRVADVPAMEEVGQYTGWRWIFEVETDEGTRSYSERFMVWLLAPLVRALDFKEVTPGRFEFEPTDALGRSVVARIEHVTLDKGKSAGKTVARMMDIQPAGKMSSENRAAMTAQAPADANDIPF